MVHTWQREVKLENLFRLEPEAFDSLSIERCKAWCYSSIACQYWQFSETQGCFVDAPMLSKTLVPYPLTTAALASGTPESSNMIAGEYIHHYCPNRTASDVDDGFAAQVPANLAVPTHLDGPRVWPWVVLSLLLTLVLMIAAFAFYSVIWKRRDTARRPLARRAMDETVADARPNVQFTPVQVAPVQAAPSPVFLSPAASPGHPTPGHYRLQGTPQHSPLMSPFGTAGYSPIAASSPFHVRQG